MRQNNLRSQSLDLLRFPLALVVLAVHVFGAGINLNGNLIAFDNMPIYKGVNIFVDSFLHFQSVPIYFFISGFVFFLGIEFTREKYVQKLKNRVKTLLIPYIIWNLIFVCFKLVSYVSIFNGVSSSNNYVFDFSVYPILMMFWDRSQGFIVDPVYQVDMHGIYPLNFPLWFVRDLMIVVLLTPVIFWFLKRMKHCAVLSLGTIWFLMGHFPDFFAHSYQIVTALFFFSWGAYMSVNNRNMITEFNRYFRLSIILYPLLGVLHVFATLYCPAATATIKSINIVVGLLFAYNLSAWLLSHGVCKVNSALASSSFFIYISHSIICNQMTRFLLVLLKPASDLCIVGIYVMSFVSTVSLLLLMYFMMKKHTPRLLTFITGRK